MSKPRSRQNSSNESFMAVKQKILCQESVSPEKSVGSGGRSSSPDRLTPLDLGSNIPRSEANLDTEAAVTLFAEIPLETYIDTLKTAAIFHIRPELWELMLPLFKVKVIPKGKVILKENGRITSMKWVLSGTVDVRKKISFKKVPESDDVEQWVDGGDPSLRLEVDVETQILTNMDSFPIVAKDYEDGKDYLTSKYQFIAATDCILATIPVSRLVSVFGGNRDYCDAIIKSSAVFGFEEEFLRREYMEHRNYHNKHGKVVSTGEASLIMSPYSINDQ